jgi:hypothetical protein
MVGPKEKFIQWVEEHILPAYHDKRLFIRHRAQDFLNFRKVRSSKADAFLPDCYINAAAGNPRRLESRSKGIFTTAFTFWRIGKL